MRNTKFPSKPIASRTQLALLVFATAVILGQLVKADVCSESVGSCKDIDCHKECYGKHPGSQSTCDKSNLCTCYYDCPPPKTCNDGLGRCTPSCGEGCCAKKCSDKHVAGVGRCDDSLGLTNVLCQCEYPC